MTNDNRITAAWLGCVSAVIFLMIVVGGVTRLTQSGLSIVEWQPLLGIIPPLNESDWHKAFDAYKQYPEYQKVNHGMNLDEFKSIFYWEYGHRALGRLIGLIFVVPFFVLLFLGRIDKVWIPRLVIALILGGLQGLMGWYMVMSGLVDIPQVSHFRLAAHLLLAIAIMVYLVWLIFDLLEVEPAALPVAIPRGLSRLITLIAVLLGVQILFGAFTAGLKAGHGFNTYPLMHGQWLADAALMMQPLWLNLFENGVMVQFVHRWVGALFLAMVIVCCVWVVRINGSRINRLLISVVTMLGVCLLQFVLGVLTLLHSVPVLLGSLHQAVACLLVLTVTFLVYISRQDQKPFTQVTQL